MIKDASTFLDYQMDIITMHVELTEKELLSCGLQM